MPRVTLAEPELNTIKGLLHYLNTSVLEQDPTKMPEFRLNVDIIGKDNDLIAEIVHVGGKYVLAVGVA